MRGIWKHWSVIVLSPANEQSQFFESSREDEEQINNAIVGASEMLPSMLSFFRRHNTNYDIGQKPPLKILPLILSSNEAADFVVLSDQKMEIVAFQRISNITKMVQDSVGLGPLKLVFRNVKAASVSTHEDDANGLPFSTLVCVIPDPKVRQNLVKWFTSFAAVSWDMDIDLDDILSRPILAPPLRAPASIPEPVPAPAPGSSNPENDEDKDLLDIVAADSDGWYDPIKADETHKQIDFQNGDWDNGARCGSKEFTAESRNVGMDNRRRRDNSKRSANVFGLRSNPMSPSYGGSRAKQENEYQRPRNRPPAKYYAPEGVQPIRRAKASESTAMKKNNGQPVRPTNIHSELTSQRTILPKQRDPQGAGSDQGLAQSGSDSQRNISDARSHPRQRSKSQPPRSTGRVKKPLGVVSGDIYDYTRVCRLFYGHDLRTITIMTLKVRYYSPDLSLQKSYQRIKFTFTLKLAMTFL